MSETVLGKRMVELEELPSERVAMTHKFSVEGQEGYVTVGLYEDGKPGELFITMNKEGSTLAGMVDAFATAISILFQCGVPLEVLVNKFSHVRFEPSGWTNNPQIPYAKSIIDYVFRWLASKFLMPAQQVAVGVQPSEPAQEGFGSVEVLEYEGPKKKVLGLDFANPFDIDDPLTIPNARRNRAQQTTSG